MCMWGNEIQRSSRDFVEESQGSKCNVDIAARIDLCTHCSDGYVLEQESWEVRSTEELKTSIEESLSHCTICLK